MGVTKLHVILVRRLCDAHLIKNPHAMEAVANRRKKRRRRKKLLSGNTRPNCVLHGMGVIVHYTQCNIHPVGQSQEGLRQLCPGQVPS